MANLILKTEALVLRIMPYSKTSHVVAWLTPQHGKITTVIKGALRSKSNFLGRYDQFSSCELLYYAKERDGLHIARECTPINMRTPLRSDWRSCCCVSYLTKLISTVSLPGGHEPGLYQLTEQTIDSFCQQGAVPQLLFWFELRLARVLGLAPRLAHCASCDRDIPTQGFTPLFSPASGGMLCPSCTKRNLETPYLSAQTVQVRPDVLAMLRNWQEADHPRAARNTFCTPEQLNNFRRILGIFLDYHLDMKTVISSRRMALELASCVSPEEALTVKSVPMV